MMFKAPPQRRRDRRLPDKADPPEPPTAAPSGPAGGDLGGTYPNPTVVGLSHAAAGGDLGGTMDAPTVVSLAHATVGPATYPAGDGSLLTGLPAQKIVVSGRLQLNTGSGRAVLGFTADPVNQIPLCSYDTTAGALSNPGILSAQIFFDSTNGWIVSIESTSSSDSSGVAWSLISIP